MKIFTIGWMSVFLAVLLINMFIWSKYWQIPFKSSRLIKSVSYLGVHIFMTIPSILYFYLFFNGKTDSRFVRGLSYFAGFYLTFLYYSTVFYLFHDLIYVTKYLFPYPQKLKETIYTLFFGGFLIFAISAFLALMSIINSKRVVTRNYNISVPKKQAKVDTINAVLITDAHIGTSVTSENIIDIAKDIEELKPDILFLGGDFFDEGTLEKDKIKVCNVLSKIKTKHGIIYIEGNHEYKAGDTDDEIVNQMKYFTDAGIIVLRDEIMKIDDSFYVIGRKDKTVKRTPLADLVDKTEKDLPIIVLDHRPNHKESAAISDVDIQLSGHTHSGQFFPVQMFDFIVSIVGKYFAYGNHEVNHLKVIVSSGIGDWGIPSRMGSRREIVNIKIELK